MTKILLKYKLNILLNPILFNDCGRLFYKKEKQRLPILIRTNVV